MQGFAYECVPNYVMKAKKKEIYIKIYNMYYSEERCSSNIKTGKEKEKLLMASVSSS